MEISEEELELKLKRAYIDGLNAVVKLTQIENLTRKLEVYPERFRTLDQLGLALNEAQKIYRDGITLEKKYFNKQTKSFDDRFKLFIEVYRRLKAKSQQKSGADE